MTDAGTEDSVIIYHSDSWVITSVVAVVVAAVVAAWVITSDNSFATLRILYLVLTEGENEKLLLR